MVRGIEGAAIFRNERDREDFLARVGKIVEEGGLRVDPNSGNSGAVMQRHFIVDKTKNKGRR